MNPVHTFLTYNSLELMLILSPIFIEVFHVVSFHRVVRPISPRHSVFFASFYFPLRSQHVTPSVTVKRFVPNITQTIGNVQLGF